MKNIEPKKILVQGPYSSYNLGDYVLLLSLLEIIDKNLSNAEVFVYSTEKNILQNMIIKDNFKYSCKINIFSNLLTYIKNLLNSNVLLIGGGSLFIKKRKSFKYFIPILISKILNKKVYIVSIDGNYLNLYYRWSLKLADKVIVRVPETYNLFKKSKKTGLYLLPDIGSIYFNSILSTLKKENEKKEINKQPMICYNSSYKSYLEDYSDLKRIYQDLTEVPNNENKLKIPKDYFSMIYKKCNNMISVHYHTLLFCHIAKIKYNIVLRTPKHNSVKSFKEKDYNNAFKNYSEILFKDSQSIQI